MAGPSKLEFLPLLPFGLHQMSLADLRELCVTPFRLSTTREPIMLGLEEVVQKICDEGFAGELWVNGSFLTEKIDPDDVDLALCVPAGFYNNGTPSQQGIIQWFASESLKASHRCDAYIWFDYPEGHTLHHLSEDGRNYWMRQYGFSRGMEAKGIATIMLPTGAK